MPDEDWIARARERIRQILANPPPPTPQQHLRNALILLENIEREHRTLYLNLPEIHAAVKQIRQALALLADATHGS
jgi:hypothetical protein